MMQRKTFSLEIRDDGADVFRSALKKMWPELTRALEESGASNFSLWQAGWLVFGYYEMEGQNGFSLKFALKNCFDRYAAGTFSWISDPASQMRLMYSNIGIVREEKNLIRHRVFMTKLKGSVENEYRRRHKALEDARGSEPDPGPDSNFTIWSAGGYIFGYDEIDTTMETDMTAEDRRKTIAWETNMLGIMDWITDDVDWITGARHEHVKRLAWYR